jgi:hypothetical protein
VPLFIPEIVFVGRIIAKIVDDKNYLPGFFNRCAYRCRNMTNIREITTK